jgi:diphthamide synthase (EF-2-diphthine--ammonia ligase)
MAIKCLLIQTVENKYFTQIKNRNLLKEYCRAFGAKMFIVKAEIEKKQVLDLSKLVPALCDKNYKNKNIEYKVIKK